MRAPRGRRAAGMALGIPLGVLMGMSQRAHTAAVAGAAVLPGDRRHRLAADPLIWFGFGLTTMTFVIVYTVLFPVVLNTVLGVRSVPRRICTAPR